MILRRAGRRTRALRFFERAHAAAQLRQLLYHGGVAAIRRARRTGRPRYTGPASGYWTSPRCHPKYAHRRPASGAPTASRRRRCAALADGGRTGHPTHAAIAVCADAAVVTHHDLVVQLDAVGHEGVFERAAIDRGVGADLDVVADGHAAQLGILPQAPCPSEGSGAKPKPSAPSTTPLWRMARAPTLTPSYRVTCACSRLSGPTEEPAPITQPGPSTAPRPMRAPDSTTQSGPMRTPLR